jgi:hypothetical protein
MDDEETVPVYIYPDDHSFLEVYKIPADELVAKDTHCLMPKALFDRYKAASKEWNNVLREVRDLYTKKDEGV